MPATSTPERHARWQRYLADIENYAVVPQPLEMQGTLVRVTGLVLEAAGVRVPVGSVCDVSGSPNEPPVTAEVVGFDGDRAFLMPTGELHGMASGARVMPRAVPHLPPSWSHLLGTTGQGQDVLAQTVAGARVIKDTTKQTLPAGFQTAEFLLKHGLIDQFVSRIDLRDRLRVILSALFLRKEPAAAGA